MNIHPTPRDCDWQSGSPLRKWISRRASFVGILVMAFGSVLGCTSPQNCQPMPGYPSYASYPSYPGYPSAPYTLPSGTSVPTVGAPATGAMAPPPMMGQPLPGSVPAYPSMNPGQPIPPGYPTGIPAR